MLFAGAKCLITEQAPQLKENGNVLCMRKLNLSLNHHFVRGKKEEGGGGADLYATAHLNQRGGKRF